MRGTVYLPGDTINITDVGDSTVGLCEDSTQNRTDPGLSLVCVTSNVNTNCCRGRDNPGGRVGNWLYPNGTIVPLDVVNPNGNFTRTSYTHQIRLNRKRSDVMSPTGAYTCQVPDGPNSSLIHTVNLTLGECNFTLN